MPSLTKASLLLAALGACTTTRVHPMPPTTPGWSTPSTPGPITRGSAEPTVVLRETTTVSPVRGAIEGGALGVLLGFGVGTVSGIMAGDDPPCVEIEGNDTWDCLFVVEFTAEEKAGIRGTLLGIGGLITGAMIGALVGHKYVDRYEGPAPTIAVTPSRDGAQATATWAF